MDLDGTTADSALSLKEILVSREDFVRDVEIRQLHMISAQISQINSFDGLGSIWSELLHTLIQNRLSNEKWHSESDEIWLASIVQLARILYRDPANQERFFSNDYCSGLSQTWKRAVALHFEYGKSPQAVSAIVKGLLSITQKLFSQQASSKLVSEARIHELVVPLLSSKDLIVVQAASQLIISCCSCAESCKQDLCKTNIIDQTLMLLKNPDLITQKLAASLLRMLCTEPEAREQVKVYDGINIMLILLPIKNTRLQWHLAWTLAQLAEDEDSALELGQLGATDLLLTELGNPPNLTSNDKADDILSLLHGYCATLSNMCQIDDNVNLLVQHNGVHILSTLLLLSSNVPPEIREKRSFVALQCAIFRALRLMFSLERHRQLFKRLFPPEFFASFIDIGHYVSDLNAYEQLVHQLQGLLALDDSAIRKSIESVNRNHDPLFHIQQYAVMERLGAGAFGCVYKVQVPGSQQSFALKEIYSSGLVEEKTTTQSRCEETKKEDKDNASMVHSALSCTSNATDIVNEIMIIKQQMRHPNIVRYRKIFVENSKLYILMDLIDGAPLKEHINSVREKKQNFSEERVWNVFVQMIMALRYLHKEKRIVHRDLNPNNVMLADNDHVIITDFGLAKHKSADMSYLKSVVGTILYSSPEIIQYQPYGEKVDIWSLGCIVYEMCALKAPFFSQNMLKLASSIVEAKYDPIPSEHYGKDILNAVDKCLTPNPTDRPDVIGVSALMVDKLLCYADQARQQHHFMKKRMEKEMAMRSRAAESSMGSVSAYTTSDSLSASNASTHFHSDGAGDPAVQDQQSTGAVVDAEQEQQVALDPSQRRTTSGKSSSGKMVTISSASSRTESGGRSRNYFRRRSANKIKEAGGIVGALSAIQPTSKIPTRARSLSGQRGLKRETVSATELPKLDAAGDASRSRSGSKVFVSTVTTLPNIRRAQSSSTLEKQQAEPLRALSATSCIINSAKLRSVGTPDPMLHLFIVLHKLLVVDQLPAVKSVDHKRRVIEQFRKQLFGPLSDAIRIRTELTKLAAQCTDPITWNMGYSDYRVVLQGLLSAVDEFAAGEKITYLTYQQLSAIIDASLEEYQGARLCQA